MYREIRARPDLHRAVVITANNDTGPFTSRIYIDYYNDDLHGFDLGTPTLTTKRHKTIEGARRWARKVLELL